MKTIQFGNEEIEYEIVRKKIKNMYITIKEQKAVVTAPPNIAEYEIEKMVYKKASWIYKNIQKNMRKQEKPDLYTEEEFISLVTNLTKELMQETGLRPRKMRVRDIKYAWGSCSSMNHVTINKKLIKYDEQSIRYVILHELCHTKHMNHSKKFWDLVETYMPNYKEVRKSLKA